MQKRTQKKIQYECLECGGVALKWQGQCPFCNKWNSMVETFANTTKNVTNKHQSWSIKSSKIEMLDSIQYENKNRILIGISELDRVLGGGLIDGSVILIGGDPGIGKSTLLLQVLSLLSNNNHDVLYVTGEESIEQIAIRSKRINLIVDKVKVLAENNLDIIFETLEKIKVKVVVIDSIQTMYLNSIPSSPGSVSQVRESTAELTRFAKAHNVCLFLVGHVTKDGAIAGPRILEHMVDTVLYFEGDANSNYRMLRAIKNRFGAVNELGIFAMLENGLRGINNYSAIFLSSFQAGIPGASILITQEGSKALLIEIQALIDKANGFNVKRVAVGLDASRLSMLLAVMHKNIGINLSNYDIFVNVVGGIKINETASDLALVLAIYSSLTNKALPHNFALFGEIGLLGEIRPVVKGLDRIKEAKKLGFNTIMVPKSNYPKEKKDFQDLTIISVSTIKDAIDYLN